METLIRVCDNCRSLCLDRDTSEKNRRWFSVGGWLEAVATEPPSRKPYMLDQALKILYEKGGCPTCISRVEEALRYAEARYMEILRRYHNEKISL